MGYSDDTRSGEVDTAPQEGNSSETANVNTERRADSSPPVSASKRIIVFSDGTGNSSGKLFRTNVYRLYTALRLGDVTMAKPQIAFYDNGVGTSSIRILAVLGGIFGLGLKRNLAELYRYVCRNFNEGDEIHAFGFSRGAFTIRLLVALICEEGIMPYKDERELNRNCADALRRFLGHNRPDRFGLLFLVVRGARDLLIRGWRGLRGHEFNARSVLQPDVEFVGVWDTVAAYGGPISEVTRGIDQYVWPLTMTDYMLNAKVRTARHALALDDERDSFWPLLWDEVAEQRPVEEITQKLDKALAKRRSVDADLKRLQQALVDELPAGEVSLRLGKALEKKQPVESLLKELQRALAERQRIAALSDEERAALALAPRLKQVWFCGMHSDVGGGYPDDSLAYVSLDWMMAEIGNRLEFIPSEKLRIEQFANPLGPMHDSRSGMAAYYRYQPRKISAMLHPRAGDAITLDETRVLRDPTIGEKPHRPQGLLLRCLIHRSVIERIAVGNDNYAPIVLPETFEVDALQPATDPKISAAIDNVESARIAGPRVQVQENHWDLVWVRRVGYFLVVAVSLLLVIAPLRDKQGHIPNPENFWLNWVDGTFAWVGGFVPGFLSPWYAALTRHWAETLVILFALFLMSQVMVGLEASLRDRMRVLWWDSVDGIAAETPEPTGLRKFRSSYLYQRTLQRWKWDVMPALTGGGILLAGVYALAVVAVQGVLYYKETVGTYCSGKSPGPSTMGTGQLLDASQTCLKVAQPKPGAKAQPTTEASLPVPLRVKKGDRYFVVIEPLEPSPEPWHDGPNIPVPAQGIATFGIDWKHVGTMALAAGFRRVGTARWLEPVVQIRAGDESDDTNLYGRAVVQQLEFGGDALCYSSRGTRTVGSFKARKSGQLFLFLNDVALPGLRPDFFYNGFKPGQNEGKARVQVRSAEEMAGFRKRCPVGVTE
ncbi:MAG TPA: DUF2235 domain-containing protein [Novosphingobium sp.]|nr:DUF2235 domain-containing protein [Novosphingobium sp.]